MGYENPYIYIYAYIYIYIYIYILSHILSHIIHILYITIPLGKYGVIMNIGITVIMDIHLND